eukprot:13366451-Alexandrium_andersonii.AAC.1
MLCSLLPACEGSVGRQMRLRRRWSSVVVGARVHSCRLVTCLARTTKYLMMLVARHAPRNVASEESRCEFRSALDELRRDPLQGAQ